MSQRGRHRKAKALRRWIPEAFTKWEQKVKTSKKEWKWQRGIVTHPLSESQCNRGHFSVKRWESEKQKRWDIPAEGFKGHVAPDGSLLGTAGKWRGGRSVVQLDCDEELGPGMLCTARWRQNLKSSAPSRRRS